MIHSVYAEMLFEDAGNLLTGEVKNNWQDIKYLLDNTDHYFIFILTKEQVGAKDRFEKYGFRDYLTHESPMLSNVNYPEQSRRLTIYVLKGKGPSYEA